MADRQRRLMILSAAPGVCGLVLLMIAGCRSPYSPYGYGYPAGGGYGPSMGGPAGGTTFITPGTVPGSPIMPGQPIASPPSGTGGTGGGISGRPSLTPTNNGDPAGKQVPNYADPNDPGATSPTASRPPKTMEVIDDADFQGPMKEKGKLDELKNDADDDFGSSMNDRRPDDDFADPMPVKTASFAESARAVENGSRPNPYAHRADFGWVRGVADFDASSSSWYVVYNPEPDSQDPYSGSLTLAPNPKLESLRPNDVVLVTGKVDEGMLDGFGKPKYAVSELQRLKPKAAVTAGP